MESARWERVQVLFHSAVALTETEQRIFLERECAGDQESAGEVLSMLEQHRRGASILDRDPADVARQVAGASFESIGVEEFHPYRNISEIGRGGMGVVFRAEREGGNPVAIKVLRDWWVSPGRQERFASEQKTLGRLEHPYIARLYHAGTLAGGTPWFAMEFVEGKHLDVYCRERQCSIKDRLSLFRRVCEAVQHAHRLGTIHRDLKPSNILVKEDGTVRLLDFGIAKQLEDANEPGTRTELRFMTLPYAAPEQVLGKQAGTYTDIYSLGVVLYELLAGQVPFDTSKVTRREAERIIIEQQPAKPSAAARANGRFAQARQSAWNDLDVLCLKAMDKEAHERYESVGSLIRDVDHFLDGEPLEARPVSFTYHAVKFVNRYRRAVFASALAFVLLAGLSAYFTLGLAKARNTALAETARTQRVERFMENLFDAGDKEAGPSDELRAVKLLDRGVLEAQGLKGDPTLQGELYQTLGSIYQRLGKLDRAASLLRNSLELRRSVFAPDQPPVAGSLLALGLLRVEQAHLPEAERLIHEALAIDQRRLPPDHPELARATAALGRVLIERAQYDKAIEVLNSALRVQSGDGGAKTDQSATLVDLADAHFYLGHYAISDSLNRQAMALHRQLHGERHPFVGEDLINLGHIQFNQGNYAEAEREYRQGLEIIRSWYGEDNAETARAVTYVGQALSGEKRYGEAKDLLEHVLASLESSRGKVHPLVALILNQLGVVASELGSLKEAEADYTQVVEIYRSVYGEKHPMTALGITNLATIYMREKQYSTAEPLFRQTIQSYTETLPPGHLNIGVARIKLGRTLARQQRYREAEGESLGGYEIVAKQTNPSIDWLQAARTDLVSIYEALNEPEKAKRFKAELARTESGR